MGPQVHENRVMSMSALHGKLLQTLGMEIASGQYEAGAVLRLEDLERRFSLSRTVVREVVRVLESMQLVESRQRVGLTIRDEAHWKVFDPMLIRWRLAGVRREEQLCSLTELRQAVEPMAARESAEYASKAQRFELLRLGEQLVEAGQAGALIRFMEVDMAFHGLILRASGNEMFAALAEPFAEALRGRTMNQLMPAQPEPAALAWHRDVAEAIAAQDPTGAEAAMRRITDEVRSQWKRSRQGRVAGT